MKNIVLITLGGTISAKGKDRLDLKDYRSGLIGGEFYLEDLPEIKEIANVEVENIDNISSTDINSNHWLTLKQKVEYFLNEKDYDGVVITHGTNTLEETAYFLHLTVNSPKPVVLTGSQRPYTALSSDAMINLIDAIRVAAHPDSHGKGVLVVFNKKIHSAREVTKTDTYDIDTFQSGKAGYLGEIDAAHQIVYYRNPLRRHTVQSEFSKIKINGLSKIEIVYSYAGADGELIRYISSSGKYKGIVIAGTGAGRFSSKEKVALKEAAENGLFIVRSNRGGHGRVLDIEPFKDLDAVSGDNLSPQKSRILLSLALQKYNDSEKIQKVFDEY